jgi:hypothetical protein
MININRGWVCVGVTLLVSACSSSSKKSEIETIDQAMESKQESAQKCFKSAQAQGNPGAPVDSGEVELSVNVSPAGLVTYVSAIRSTMNSKYLEDCLIGEIRRIKFPKEEGGRIRQMTRVYKFGTQPTATPAKTE